MSNALFDLRRAPSAGLALLLTLSVAPDLDASPALGGYAGRGQVALEMSLFTDEDARSRFTALAPVLRAQLELAPSLLLSLDYGMVHGRLSSEELSSSLSASRSGNPFLAAHHLVGLGEDTDLRLGLGIALPLASLPDPSFDDARDPVGQVLLSSASYAGVMASRGVQEAWLWALDTVSLVVPLRLESAGPHVRAGVDAALAILIPVRDEGGRRETDVMTQLGGDVGYIAGPATLGARLQLAWLPTAGEASFAQLSAEPFVRLDFGRVFALAALTVNLDEPMGFAFDEGGVWGARFGAGATF